MPYAKRGPPPPRLPEYLSERDAMVVRVANAVVAEFGASDSMLPIRDRVRQVLWVLEKLGILPPERIVACDDAALAEEIYYVQRVLLAKPTWAEAIGRFRRIERYVNLVDPDGFIWHPPQDTNLDIWHQALAKVKSAQARQDAQDARDAASKTRTQVTGI